MSPRLVFPQEVAVVVATRMASSWHHRICAEQAGEAQNPIVVPLRPGVTGTTTVHEVGLEEWTRWRSAWSELAPKVADVPGVRCEVRKINVARLPSEQPFRLHLESFAAAEELVEQLDGSLGDIDPDRARRIATDLTAAGGRVTPTKLKVVYGLSDGDLSVLVAVVAWCAEHQTLGEWTMRQLPVPGMHTKWFEHHVGLVSDLVGRNLATEVKRRPSVVHLSYVDQSYLSTGGRRHDAWTTGDQHDLAYHPRVVLVVENRDSRLWFPAFPGTVVVEGGGRAAAALLSDIPWIQKAEHVVYWGDIDGDGFSILDHLRASMAERGVHVESILMDEHTRTRYADHGVREDREHSPLRASTSVLKHLTPAEQECYASIATRGNAGVRRIEQEKIPMVEAVRALRVSVGG